MLKQTILAMMALMPVAAVAQTFDFDMTKQQPVYSDAQGYGYDVLPAPDDAGISRTELRRCDVRLSGLPCHQFQSHGYLPILPSPAAGWSHADNGAGASP